MELHTQTMQPVAGSRQLGRGQGWMTGLYGSLQEYFAKEPSPPPFACKAR
jgi:hypothetical protein